MTTTINYFGRMLCAFLLCTGMVVTSCESEEPIDNGENTEQGGNQETPEPEAPATITLGKVTAATANFTGHLNVAASDLSFSQVTVYYSDAETFNMNSAESVSVTSFDNEQNFTITLTNLKYGTKYNYCMVAEVKSENTYGDVLNFTTENVTLSELSVVPGSFKAELSGSVTGLSEEDKEHIKIGVLYSSQSGKIENGEGNKVDATEISADGAFSIVLSRLALVTKYYCCCYVYQSGSYTYGSSAEFTTFKHPYSLSYDLDVSSATDLSSSASANSYIVSNAGLYKFKTIKGNSSESVGNVASATILWESFGTSTAPVAADLIKAFCYNDGYIAFQTAETFKEGNAVIAAKDASGNILWSWHIWLTDQPEGQEYYNNAGIMMDRNLGATSATPGDDGTHGLFYQWGRKDPFLGIAASTTGFPKAVTSNSSIGTIDYAIAHPTTFIDKDYMKPNKNHDWYYNESSSTDNTRWTTSDKTKSIYDPCPAGWRVPDGGSNGVWSKALGSTANFELDPYCCSNGWNFSGKFGSASTIFYPRSGYIYGLNQYMDNESSYWSASPKSFYAHTLRFEYSGSPANNITRERGLPVRCIKEKE